MAKKKKQGHYCHICGERKANEKFSGKGHAKHICKECDVLPQEKKNELQAVNRIAKAGEKYPKSRQDWELLEKYARSSKYPQAKEMALFFLEMSGRATSTQTYINPDAEEEDIIPLSEIDMELREDIIAEMYEQIINYMYQKETFPDGKQKQKTLEQIRDSIFVEYKELLSEGDDLSILYDRTLLEVIEDIENDEF